MGTSIVTTDMEPASKIATMALTSPPAILMYPNGVYPPRMSSHLLPSSPTLLVKCPIMPTFTNDCWSWQIQGTDQLGHDISSSAEDAVEVYVLLELRE